jgi:hypothetical protein
LLVVLGDLAGKIVRIKQLFEVQVGLLVQQQGDRALALVTLLTLFGCLVAGASSQATAEGAGVGHMSSGGRYDAKAYIPEEKHAA